MPERKSLTAACACSQKSKQKFAVIAADGSQKIYDTYQQAQKSSRETGGKIRVVNGA